MQKCYSVAMHIEYEATFLDLDKDEMRLRLTNAGAKLLRPEFSQRRTILLLPHLKHARKEWMRVRDEGDKVTLAWKAIGEAGIDDQREIQITVDNYDATVELLVKMGCVSKSYQETLRVLWILDGVEICIDTWPFLEPYVEVEGASEAEVRSVSEKLGFDWSTAYFAGVGRFYQMKYGDHADPSETPRLTFDMQNPYA